MLKRGVSNFIKSQSFNKNVLGVRPLSLEKSKLYIQIKELGLLDEDHSKKNLNLFTKIDGTIHHEKIHDFIYKLDQYKIFDDFEKQIYLEKILKSYYSFSDDVILQAFEEAHQAGLFAGDIGRSNLHIFFNNLSSAKRICQPLIILHKENLLYGLEGDKNRDAIINSTLHSPVLLARAFVILAKNGLLEGVEGEKNRESMANDIHCITLAEGFCILKNADALNDMTKKILSKQSSNAKELASCLSIFVKYNLHDEITEKILLEHMSNKYFFQKDLKILDDAGFFNDPENRNKFITHMHSIYHTNQKNKNVGVYYGRACIDFSKFITREVKIDLMTNLLKKAFFPISFIDIEEIYEKCSVYYEDITRAIILLYEHNVLNINTFEFYYTILSMESGYNALDYAGAIITLQDEGYLEEGERLQNLTLIFGEDFMDKVYAICNNSNLTLG